MKIAYISLKSMPLPGGIEKYTEEIGSRIHNMGHHVIVYSSKYYGQMPSVYKGMTIYQFNIPKIRSIDKLLVTLFGTIHALFITKPDIYHFHAFGPSLFSVLPKLLGKTTIVQGHGLEWKRQSWNWLARQFLYLTERISVYGASSITVVSRVQQRYILKKYKKTSTYIPTGVTIPDISIAMQPILNLNVNERYILFLSRIVEEKGLHTLIEAYSKCNLTMKLLIVGPYDNNSSYFKKIFELTERNPNILIAGPLMGEELKSAYQNASIFVLPSTIEGLPTVLLEALSYGLTCVASDIPENKEALSGRGFTFKTGSVEDLSLLLLQLQSADLSKIQDTDYLSSFDWDFIAQKFIELYETT